MRVCQMKYACINRIIPTLKGTNTLKPNYNDVQINSNIFGKRKIADTIRPSQNPLDHNGNQTVFHLCIVCIVVSIICAFICFIRIRTNVFGKRFSLCPWTMQRAYVHRIFLLNDYIQAKSMFLANPYCGLCYNGRF